MRILLVDDEEDSRQYLASFLCKLGHHVIEASDGRQGWEAFASNDFHLVLSDIRMPGWTGLELLTHIRQQTPLPESDVVLFTAHAQVQTAVEALRIGAYDYLLKPVNVKELVACIERVSEHQDLIRQNRVLTHHFQESVDAVTEDTKRELEQWKKAYAKISGTDSVLLTSPLMQKIYSTAESLRQDPSIPILIEGETGTGKEILARYIHYGMKATTEPFIDINCAAIPPTMFETELFGYEAGTFTGALPKGQKGKLDLAMGGTLFLDEITEMPVELQAKLLRIIQDKDFYRVGGLKKCIFNGRLVAASNVNIKESLEKGTFRNDLYYRLSIAHIQIPPLREHREDILPLSYNFLSRFAQEKGKNFRSISLEAENQLQKYDWPGNIRELRNVLERATLMYDGSILKPAHLQLGIVQIDSATNNDHNHMSGSTFILNQESDFELPADHFPLDTFVDRLISQAMLMKKGNITKTAHYLGISRRSLDYRLHKKELE
ncbi:MAG: sigma-54 dependent transcriptional regulator [Syntrophomonadaceae bacterium]|nr:sigma-54 dependent transcriptional regulator [Syntrophomonadaceae bacterium]MDD3022864.1 sigma-54 dependent transcriptional regulator [Syntrophomonadaceae bacterium]